MQFIKLTRSPFGSYHYCESSNIEMDILGNFLTDDVGCYWPSFMEWALNDGEESTSSNITALRKERGKVFLSDLYSEETFPTELEMPLAQFIKILDDWRDKVCKEKPKEVIIKHDNGEFVIETH